jgi:hypothetical protein
MSSLRSFAFTVALLALATSAVAADPPAASLTALLDRAQIEDMLVDYYSGLGAKRHDFGAYYVADGVLDVNGIVAQGQQPIEDLYKKIAASAPPRPGTFRMMLSNIKVVVNGDAATADMLWTGVNSEKVTAPPQFIEQGREHDELVKRGGRWLFKHRVITSDGGLPPMFEKTYQKR